MNPRVLVIDDNDGFRSTLAAALSHMGYEPVVPAGELGKVDVRAAISKTDYDLVITDVFMPEMDGLEVIQLLHSVKPDCPVIAMSGGSEKTSALISLKMAESFGADRILYKPFKSHELDRAIRSLLDHRAV